MKSFSGQPTNLCGSKISIMRFKCSVIV
uniref:Uncharacterized protein n=1 Tax=Schistosoma mansoni TaxID=6183 RepID=A0AA82MNM4_SCHMA